jgi:hypothetical protein
LEAQCEQLNLELAKVRLERKQSALTKALAVEPKEVIQPNPGSGTQLKKAKQITDFLFLTSLDSIEESLKSFWGSPNFKPSLA